MMTLCVLLTTIPCLEMMLFSGTAMYSQIDSYPGNPYSSNSTGVEITVIRCKDCSTCTYIWNMPLTSCAIGTIFPEII